MSTFIIIINDFIIVEVPGPFSISSHWPFRTLGLGYDLGGSSEGCFYQEPSTLSWADLVWGEPFIHFSLG